MVCCKGEIPACITSCETNCTENQQAHGTTARISRERAVQVEAGAEQGRDSKMGNGGSSKTNRSFAHYHSSSYRRKEQDHCVLVGQADAEGMGTKHAIESSRSFNESKEYQHGGGGE